MSSHTDNLSAADIFLWKDKKISGGLLGVATMIWVFFELLEYHLLSLVCHILILALAVLFLWSNVSTFINNILLKWPIRFPFLSFFLQSSYFSVLLLHPRSSPKIPEVIIPEDVILSVASAFRVEFNRGFAIIRDIARGRDLKKFVAVIVGLWVLSVLGSWCSFLTLFYVGFILVHTVPVIYEKYDAQIDAFAERAEAEFKKQYAVFDAKVSSKIPKGIKDKLP